MKPDHPVILWLDKYIVEPLDFKQQLPRVFGLTIGYRRPDGEWGAQFAPPAWKGGWLWRNGLVSFYLHLPLGLSLSVRLPVPYGGRTFGWTLQTMIGWKSYNGRPAAIFRIQNDDCPAFNNPSGPQGRTKGLDEGWV